MSALSRNQSARLYLMGAVAILPLVLLLTSLVTVIAAEEWLPYSGWDAVQACWGERIEPREFGVWWTDGSVPAPAAAYAARYAKCAQVPRLSFMGSNDTLIVIVPTAP